MNTAQAHTVLSAWPRHDPWSIESVIMGGNNVSYHVASGGLVCLLRIYQNTNDEERVRYEHNILEMLTRSNLSFAVPAPLRTASGDSLVAVNDGEQQKLAALFPLIRGQQASGKNIVQARACGKALGELNNALRRLDISAPRSVFPPFGLLPEIHGLAANTKEIVEHLAIEEAEHGRLGAIVRYLEQRIPALYGSLPQQIVHRDFDASNVLMVNDQVVGILDFEFAGPDLRAIDLACSLSQYIISPGSDSQGWPCVVAFVGGYRERQQLTLDEINAVPDLIRLNRLISMIHRERRRRQGLASPADVLARVRGLLRADEWLHEKGQQLITMLA